MSTRTSLRRSRRAPKKQNSDYSVGDLVEIERNEVTLKARLAQLLSEGSSVHPRWLVKFEGPYKDEEVYEHTFGKILESAEGDVSSIELEHEPLPRKATITAPTKKTAKKDDSNNEAGEAAEPGANDMTEAQKFSTNESSPPGSGEESSESAKVSAREERSRRRQAIIDEFGIQTNGSGSVLGKRKLVPKGGANNKKRGKNDHGEKCLKVKLLTGTLYLYRGRHRRAEFVRRV